MSIVDISSQLEELIVKNDLVNIASPLKNEYAISKSEELQKAISQIEDEGRVLKIGIVGRVKAGKSSLLNALVFDGEDILPKAATPMTAALTILEYSEETKAEVDFFTQNDIDDIEREYNSYIKQLASLVEKEYDKLKKIKLKNPLKTVTKQENLTDEEQKEIRQKAENRANKEMRKNDKLFSSCDQYEKIKESGVSLSELEKFKTIEADNAAELNRKLLEFVGANGKYMPFTKSVTLKLNQEGLRDIQIIDTPGVNDPVASREDRTKELLKYCDVVLVVSPSGQFLSSEDIDLMDRITTKEGIKEIYLVASQADNQLFGSEKEKGNAILGSVLNVIEDNLSNLQREVLTKQKEQYPEIGDTFDSLINNRVVLSSGISFGMIKSFDNQSAWDENTQKVWENLNKHYKDFFNDREIALANLEKLANINEITSIINCVRDKKDEILEKRKEEFVSTKLKGLLNYKKAIEKDINESVEKVKNSDIDEIRVQKEQMLIIQTKTTDAVNEEYFDIVESLEIEIKSRLNDKVNSYFKKSKKDIKDSEGSDTEEWEVSDSSWYNPFSYGRTKTKSRTFTTVKAGHIRNSLEELTDEIEYSIDQDSKEYIFNWKKTLYKSIVSALRTQADDNILDATLISKTIRAILNSVKYPDICYDGVFPKKLKKSGTLKDHDAEHFIDEAGDYVSSLKSRVKTDIKSYVNSLVDVLKGQNIGESIFVKYTKEIEKLESDIENKELSLDRYNHILKQLEAVNA